MPDDDKLSGVTKDNYRYYDALDYYRTCLRRGYFVEDDILKIKRETGGSDSVEITMDDFDKIVQWQIAHNLVDKDNNADGKFGENSIKVYNNGKDPSKMIITKRKKLNYPDKKDVAKNTKLISYLKSDDIVKYDIHLDNSDSCKFYNDMDEFLTNYSTQQTIPFSFIKKLVDHRNFALITIIISTANYGVTDIPEDLALRELDPVVKGGYYSSDDAFERCNTGKNAYASPPVGSSEPINGGLGIAHFDDSHYLEFYKVFGFPEGCDINDLLYKKDSNNNLVPIDRKDAYLTNNTQTNPLLVSNISLIINNKDVIHPKTYDDSEIGYRGVKQNGSWQAWASKIVSSRIRQQYLFHYWKEHFWNQTINSYSNESKRNPQNPNISLQNVIRSARAKNSGVGVDPTLSPELLYNRYSASTTNRNERRIIQKMNIKRALVLIEYILSNGTTQMSNNKLSNSVLGDDNED